MDMDTSKLGSKFANKIWNAARFILMNMEGRELLDLRDVRRNIADRWVLHKLNLAVKTVEEAMVSYRFDDMAHAIYEYFWNDYCDWYVECAKLGLYGEDEDEKNRTATMLIHVLGESLKLMHPFLPFITEEIWSKLPGERRPLIISAYPEFDPAIDNPQAETAFNALKELVTGVRTMRSEFTVPPSNFVKVRVETHGGSLEVLRSTQEIAAVLVRSDNFAMLAGGESPAGSLPVVGRGFTAHVYIRDSIDVDAVIDRFRKTLDKTLAMIEGKRKKLSNDDFVSRAPADIIEKEQASLAEMEDSARRSAAYLAALES
jgi:valyl-tRNA synthetase